MLGRLRRKGALRPFRRIGLEWIDLSAIEALEFGAAGLTEDGFHARMAMRAAVHGTFPDFPRQRMLGTKVPVGRLIVVRKGKILMMQAAIDRVMHTYGMLVNLTLDQEQAARKKVTDFLAQSKINDENLLAVEGIKFLRDGKPSRRRNTSSA